LVESEEATLLDFSFRRVRFHFTALERLRLYAGQAGNTIRGAFGLALHQTAPAEEYGRLFKPHAAGGPSGLADQPRPFVFRCSHLEGLDAVPGAEFWLDAHFFDVEDSNIAWFEAAFAVWRPAHARVRLDRVETSPPHSLSLEPDAETVERTTVRFLTATELKLNGAVTSRPEFAVLFARVRDRVATLRAIYGGGAPELDFAAMGKRAAAIRMTRCDIQWSRAVRKSGSTGQVHPIGGFTGEVEYAGSLAEFLPWLRAAQFTGVGRQTVWGKGELQVLS
jgi:CRISPR-associated endoribonuclease Cas6